jgi:GNAT superfamily N-acetyltransferase
VTITCRSPRRSELTDCAFVWYSAVDEYMARLGRPLPSPHLDPLLSLMDHLLTTDAERFVVAVRPGQAGRPEQVVGYAIATQRGPAWYLNQLYVMPSDQHRGVGRTLLEHVLPTGLPTRAHSADPRVPVLATCTDSAQPISNGLYSRYGIVPRVPVINLVGTPRPAFRLPTLPEGVEAKAAEQADVDSLDLIDRSVLGYSHPIDHAFHRASGRRCFVYRTATGEPLAYGYHSEVGRFGPVAALDPALMGPVIGHLLATVRARGAVTVWVPGANDLAMTTLLAAGLRIEGFPAMLCWNKPFADFDRYLPASLALL